MQELHALTPGSAVQDGFTENIPAEDPLTAARNLPMRLVLETAVVDFTVRSMMLLEPGSIVETASQQNEDLMLHVNGQPVGPVKFDVSGDNLAVRLTGVA